MSDIDPDTLLEWLQTGNCDVTLLALEQLWTILLLSDNIDRCFEQYPPKSFLPALCKIFLDELATDSVLEATARAITYYLDVSQECTRRIVAVEGTLRAICNRLLVIQVFWSFFSNSYRSSKALVSWLNAPFAIYKATFEATSFL